jgi:hypothetical protein
MPFIRLVSALPYAQVSPGKLSVLSLLAVLSVTSCNGSGGADPASPSHAVSSEAVDSSATSCARPDGARTFEQMKSDEARAAVQACVPVFTSQQLDSAFALMRDFRGLTAPEQPDFPRRISWLLPDNGCEVRANQAAYWLHEAGYETPYFARATGDLGLDTPNDVNGKVRWPGHVAPVVRVDEELVVLDPAVEPTRPLPISEWLTRISLPGSTTALGLCENFGLKDDCFSAERPPMAPGLMRYLLSAEWLSQRMLGLDPSQTLGDCPPWVGCPTHEAVSDPNLPPSIELFAQDVWQPDIYPGLPIYVVGSNFVPGLTTLRVSGNGIERAVTTADTLPGRTILTDDLASGVYEVTAYNGSNASPAVTLTVYE